MHEQATNAASAVTVTLIQYGAVGALLLVFLGVFLWLFYRLINKMLGEWSEQWRAISNFMNEQVKALQAVQDTQQENHRDVMSEFRHLNREPSVPIQTRR